MDENGAFRAEGRLCWWEGRGTILASKSTDMGAKGAFSCQKGAFEGRRVPTAPLAPCRICFEVFLHKRKGRLLLTEGCFCWREGRRICFEGRRHEQKGHFFRPEGHLRW